MLVSRVRSLAWVVSRRARASSSRRRCARARAAAASSARRRARSPSPRSPPPPPIDPVAEQAAHHAALVVAARALYDGGTWEGARLGATNFVTSVLSAPVWPEDADAGESVRLGYLRHGARVAVIPDPIVNDSCPDGWLELVQGGFVCGKNATLDPKNPRVRLAPHAPDLSKSLPYQYGVNIANGTPLYRRVLSLEDRKKYEPWLAPAPKPAAPSPPATSDEDDEALDAGPRRPPPPERPARASPTRPTPRRPPGTCATAGARRSRWRSSTATASSCAA